jgi:hypothetical protein
MNTVGPNSGNYNINVCEDNGGDFEEIVLNARYPKNSEII